MIKIIMEKRGGEDIFWGMRVYHMDVRAHLRTNGRCDDFDI